MSQASYNDLNQRQPLVLLLLLIRVYMLRRSTQYDLSKMVRQKPYHFSLKVTILDPNFLRSPGDLFTLGVHLRQVFLL